MRRVLSAASLVIALGACGGAQPRSQTAAAREPPGSVDDYEQRIAHMQTGLAGSLGDLVNRDLVRPDGQSLMEEAAAPDEVASQPVPDCPAAADLRDRICELAGRICTIAERDPGSGDLQAKCDSARTACERAREDVAASCADE